MSIAMELLVILALVLANGVFAGAEIAILSVRKTRLAELEAEGRRRGRALALLRKEPETFLATVQIGITVVSATAAAFGGATVSRLLAGILVRLGVTSHAEDLALALVVVGVSYLSLVLGELVPKSLALRGAEKYALLVALPLRALATVARPLVWFLTASSNVVLRVFGDETTFTEARLSKEELQQLVDEATTSGVLDPRAGEIAYRALDFGGLRIAAVMVPRQDMVSLPRGATREVAVKLLVERGHSRIPVHGASTEDIVGYVTARDLVARIGLGGELDLGAIMREPMFVPESRRAADVLRDMQEKRYQMALVVDEQGLVSGLVTLEDLVEELVGEIFAEHDKPEDPIRREPGGTALVRGRLPVHEVNRELELELPEGPDFTTIAGLVTSVAGIIPRAGSRFEVEGVVLEVVEATPRRVAVVRIHPRRHQGGAET